MKYWGVYMVAVLGSAWFFFDSMTLYGDSFSDKMKLEGNTGYDSLYMYDRGEVTDPLQFDIGMSENYIKTLHGTDVRYSDYQKRGTSISSWVDPGEWPQEDEYLVFPLYYYPGYEILVDGRKVEAVSQEFLLACRLPDEAAYIQVDYKGMAGWRIADIVSLITALVFGGCIVRHRTAVRKGMDDENYTRLGISQKKGAAGTDRT